jgi:mannose-6-phosphate isomerase-like protein (cupin superfamily)
MTSTKEKTTHPELIQKRDQCDYLAPDSAEIRILLTEKNASKASLCHCKLPPGKVSIAQKHQTVEELWYFVSGNGELWIKSADNETIHPVRNGSAITIPPDVSYQFRNLDANTALEFIVTTIPHWPGPQESFSVQGKWQPSVRNE